ncbi:MAG: flagellar hook-length control protein FliK [Sideroxydans sp.]|jgi:hypothetical protein
MLPADLLTATLNRIVTTDNKPLIAGNPDQKNSPALKLEVGQQVQGTVQAKVAPDVFQVRVADRTIQMQLPATVRSGDLVALRVVALQPRLTFSLAASSNPLSTSEQLGSIARLLSSLAQQPMHRDYVPASQQSPLWIGTKESPNTAQLAEKLHLALSHSGLFYEAHQAQWIAGKRSTPQLMQEPHNQLPNSTAPADPGAPRTSAIPEQLQAIVQQQLNALENKQVVWQGLAWPGQEMHWTVGEETGRQAGEQTDKHWFTELHLDLPTLGGVTARLRFNGEAVTFEIDTANAVATQKLTSASTQLADAMNAHGVPVLQTRIRCAPETTP